MNLARSFLHLLPLPWRWYSWLRWAMSLLIIHWGLILQKSYIICPYGIYWIPIFIRINKNIDYFLHMLLFGQSEKKIVNKILPREGSVNLSSNQHHIHSRNSVKTHTDSCTCYYPFSMWFSVAKVTHRYHLDGQGNAIIWIEWVAWVSPKNCF